MSVQIEVLTEDYTGIISEAEYQEYLRFDGTDQDNVLPLMVTSAINMAEHHCNATIGNKTFKYQNDKVCQGLKYWLPYPKVNAITSVTLNGNALTEDTHYTVGGLKNKYIIFNTGGEINGRELFEVEYSAGYTNALDVPKGIKEAVLGILSENFENRQDGVMGSNVSIMPRNSIVMLAPYKNPQFT